MREVESHRYVGRQFHAHGPAMEKKEKAFMQLRSDIYLGSDIFICKRGEIRSDKTMKVLRSVSKNVHENLEQPGFALQDIHNDKVNHSLKQMRDYTEAL